MSTYSPSLRIELIATGDQAGVWGTTTNTNLGTLVESAIAGYTSVSITSAAQALTALDGLPDQSRNMVLALTTTTTAAFAVYAPPVEKLYVVYNASAYPATVYNSTVLGNTTAAGTGALIPAGRTVAIWSDGTNFAYQNTNLQTSPTGSNITATGTTAQRDGSPASGYFRFNSTTGSFEGYNGATWLDLGYLRFNAGTGSFESYNGTTWLGLGRQTTSTGSLVTPAGTTAQRDAAPAGGYFRFNTTTTSWEGYNGSVWKAVGGGATGGGADEVFVENSQNVTVNYTIPSTRNAMSTGPISIDSGVTVTVSSGSRWVVI
jgi:hypothetical protein